MYIELLNKEHNIDVLLNLDTQAVENFINLFEGKYSQQEILDLPVLIESKQGEFYIGKENERIIAMGGYKKIDDNNAKLIRFRVENAFQGKGLGSQFLGFVESKIKQQGFTRISFETASHRKKTLSFYNRHGYSIVGERQFLKLTLLEFEKKLS